ncbi:MAG: hypothetical protein ACLP53_27510, partial [Isosphaeraceae bacterium]
AQAASQTAPSSRQKNAQSTTQAGSQLDAKTMKMALRTTCIEDQGFIERVVRMTHEGKLPGSLVDSSFDWARKKERHQFQYFKYALTTQAAQQGIDLSQSCAKDAAAGNARNSAADQLVASEKTKTALKGLLMPLRLKQNLWPAGQGSNQGSK